MKKTSIPHFAKKSDLFAFLVKNKHILEAEKKAIMKHGDGVMFSEKSFFDATKATTSKGNNPIDAALIMMKDRIGVRAVINTTNFLDSHSDVHIPGLWKKSLSINKMLMHVQEHTMTFDHIIADGAELNPYTETMSWKELGFKYKGETEALIFDSVVLKERNPFMFQTYAKGRVKNHSVGMRYIQMVMCINDEDYGAEYEAWQKYYPMIANSDVADDQGYFWAIKEARAIEGSAVPIGSNIATPTLENNLDKSAEEQQMHSEQEQPKGTLLNYRFLADNLK
jgi:hypothetical protein